MPKLQGFDSLKQKLRDLSSKASDVNTAVIVGFSQRYAIKVHEDTTAYHKVGQAKYLEEPSRTLRHDLAKIIQVVYKKTGSMRQALIIAGLRLQRAAQELVPVDTSALKASAYTAVEDEAENAAISAFNKSEQIRLAKSK